VREKDLREAVIIISLKEEVSKRSKLWRRGWYGVESEQLWAVLTNMAGSVGIAQEL
jgi:hypothetical protein